MRIFCSLLSNVCIPVSLSYNIQATAVTSYAHTSCTSGLHLHFNISHFHSVQFFGYKVKRHWNIGSKFLSMQKVLVVPHYKTNRATIQAWISAVMIRGLSEKVTKMRSLVYLPENLSGKLLLAVPGVGGKLAERYDHPLFRFSTRPSGSVRRQGPKCPCRLQLFSRSIYLATTCRKVTQLHSVT